MTPVFVGLLIGVALGFGAIVKGILWLIDFVRVASVRRLLTGETRYADPAQPSAAPSLGVPRLATRGDMESGTDRGRRGRVLAYNTSIWDHAARRSGEGTRELETRKGGVSAYAVSGGPRFNGPRSGYDDTTTLSAPSHPETRVAVPFLAGKVE